MWNSRGLAPAAVVVAGGGIVGLSVAFELARRRVDVLVLERRRIGAGAAGVAAGMLSPASEAEHATPALTRLAQESQHRYPDWVHAVEETSGVDCGLRQEGTLLVALGRDDEDELARIAQFQARLGIAAEWLTAQQVRTLEPQLSPRVTAALCAPHDHQVNPQATLEALHRAIVALGGRIVEGAAVDGFEIEGGRLYGVTGRHAALEDAGALRAASGSLPGSLPAVAGKLVGERLTVGCEVAVLAAGAWSSQDLAWPAAPLGVRPVKGQLLHLQGPDLIRHVVRTPAVYLVPRHGGRLVVGATMEEQGFDATPTAGAVMDLLWSARLVVPGMYDLALADVRVGFRPATRDHAPIIGATAIAGLHVATGHFRHGVLLAPATATMLADELLGGAPSPLLAPFRPQRGAVSA